MMIDDDHVAIACPQDARSSADGNVQRQLTCRGSCVSDSTVPMSPFASVPPVPSIVPSLLTDVALAMPGPAPPTALASSMRSCSESSSFIPPPMGAPVAGPMGASVAGSVPSQEDAEEDDLVVAEIAAVALESVADIIGE